MKEPPQSTQVVNTGNPPPRQPPNNTYQQQPVYYQQQQYQPLQQHPCHFHPTMAAVTRCEYCNKNLCLTCRHKTFVNKRTADLCKECAEETRQRQLVLGIVFIVLAVVLILIIGGGVGGGIFFRK